MYEFWYDYIKPLSIRTVQLYVIWIQIALLSILKLKIFILDVADDVEKRSDISNYDVDRPLPKITNEKVIRLMKDELWGKIIIEFVALRLKAYSYLTDDDTVHKKAKQKKSVIKRILKFNAYKDRLIKNKVILESQQRFKSEAHSIYSERINRIVLSSNDDKKLQTFDGITAYPYGTNTFIVGKSEMLSKYKRWLHKWK